MTISTMSPADAHPPEDPARLASGSGVDEHIRSLLSSFLRVGASRRRDRVQLEDMPDAIAPSAHLTARHLAAAGQLFLHGELTVGELAGHLDVTYATASLVATEIERAGLLERVRDPADGRRVVLRLHPRVAKHAMKRRIEPLRRTLERLDRGERDTFVKAMGIFADELERR